MHCNIGELVVIERLAEGSSKTADCLATMQGKAIQVVCLIAARQRPGDSCVDLRNNGNMVVLLKR